MVKFPSQGPEPSTQLSNKHSLGMALVIVGLIMGSAILMIWMGLRFLVGVRRGPTAAGESPGQEVTIRTPVGSLVVQDDFNPARLGLPVYPGAERAKASGSARIDLQLPNDQALQVWTAKYQTNDPLEQVVKFYDQQFPAQSAHAPAQGEGKIVYDIKQEGEERIVTIERHGAQTTIQLARIVRGAAGPN